MQKYILPTIISKLEENIAQNTPFRVKMAKPVFRFIAVTIPEIEINYNGTPFFIKNLQLNPSLFSIPQRKIDIKGKGIIFIGENLLNFEIKNFTYKQKTNELKLRIYFPPAEANFYVNMAAYIGGVDLEELKNVSGKATLLLNFTKIKQPELELFFTTEDISANYKGSRFDLPVLKTTYQKSGTVQKLEATVENFSIRMPNIDRYILKQCSFNLKSDLKKLSLDKIKTTIMNSDWEGSLEISDLKNNPTGSFNLKSELCNATGKIKQIKNTLNFNANLSKEKTSFDLKGAYNSENQMLNASGSGNTDIKTLLSFMNITKGSVLNTLDADLKISDLKISYNKIGNIFSGYIESDIGQLTIDKHIFSDKGKLTVSIQNNNLELKNLTLINGYGNIQSKGNIALKEQKPFQAEIHINNYEVKHLTQPFIEKDTGNALFSANCSIQGNIKEQNSILGVCKWAFTQGNIGQLKFLSRIASLINKPELEEISFNSGEGTITFKDNIFDTPGSVLISPHLNLSITGTMHTRGDLNLTLTTKFPQEESAAEDDSLFGKFGKILSAGMGELFHKIQITGTIQNPKYTVVPAVDKILQKIFQ